MRPNRPPAPRELAVVGGRPVIQRGIQKLQPRQHVHHQTLRGVMVRGLLGSASPKRSAETTCWPLRYSRHRKAHIHTPTPTPTHLFLHNHHHHHQCDHISVNTGVLVPGTPTRHVEWDGAALLAPVKVPCSCQIWTRGCEYAFGIAILGNPVA